MQHAYEFTGRLIDARSVSLDEPLQLASGQMHVTLRSIAPVASKPHHEAIDDVRPLWTAARHVTPSPDAGTLHVALEPDD